MAKMHVHTEQVTAAFLKVPLIHLLGGSFSRSMAAWPRRFSGTGEYSGHPGPQCLAEGK